MANVNVKLIGVVAGAAGVFYGINFEAIGTGVLSADKQSFRGIALVATGINEKLVKSLIDVDKLEVLTDKEVDALREKASPKVAR
jgi:hypothetical protein